MKQITLIFYLDWGKAMDHKKIDQWYVKNAHLYDSLAQSVVQILKSIMKAEKISFVDVPYRVKTKDSCIGKLKKKSDYTSFEDMTDLAGLRIITLVESDLEKVSKIISENFNVHEEDSGDKADLLGADKFGYRSIHFVCDIGKQREKLPEFSLYKDLCFEIQIRTALSHAWAEIEHDRGYKLGGELPAHLKRRFNLLSGLLESADLEFNRLSEEINLYKIKLQESDKYELFDQDINKLSLINFLNRNVKEHGLDPKKYSIINFDYEGNVIYFFHKVFNLKKIIDIEKMWRKHEARIFENKDKIKYLSAFYSRMFAIEDLEKFLLVLKQLNIPIYDDIYSSLTKLYNEDLVDQTIEKLQLFRSNETLED
ncbi:GTP pyrophosphokinase [Acinetobacter sp. KS-LM10]|uniref:GTP pyrophosphokinase n=1 Tax=Acinetobacter sp. KS-LM10 TaxID=3120518 RepID=UPI0030CE5155